MKNKIMTDDYKVIRTNKGEPILVSSDCYDKLSKHVWHINNVGVVVRARKKSDPVHYPKHLVAMSREILGFVPNHFRIWFCNRNMLDHRFENMIAVPAWLHMRWTKEYEEAVKNGQEELFEPIPWKDAIKK